MRRSSRTLIACVTAAGLVLSACATDEPDETAPADDGQTATDGDEAAPPEEGDDEEDATAVDDAFFDQDDFERQLAQRDVDPEGDPNEPWLQAIEPEMVDTSEYALDADADRTMCFSNASVSNP